MKTPIQPTLLTLAVLCFSMALPLQAQGPGRGQGRGQGRGPGGPGGFQEAIHTLFDNHEKIKRTVEMTDTGYTSRTVSDDPEIAKTLQKHVKEMQDRLGSGMMIRRWDPAFAELVEHYQEIDHEFKEVDGGVEMIARGKTPDAVKVAQNHARIVSGFVKKGPDQMHKTHPAALAGGAAPADAASNDAGGKKKEKEKTTAACPKCHGQAKAKADCPPCPQGAGPAGEGEKKNAAETN